MRIWITSLITIGLLSGAGACSRKDQPREARHDDHSVANDVGRAAYKLSQETKKAATKAAQELNKAGKEAHQGWKEAKQESKAKDK